MDPKPPQAYEDFTARFPSLAEAWTLMRREAEAGPVDVRTLRLVKLGIAVGCRHEGAVRSAARRARAEGIPLGEVEQVIASAASTVGLPATVAAFGWAASAWGRTD